LTDKSRPEVNHLGPELFCLADVLTLGYLLRCAPMKELMSFASSDPSAMLGIFG
jgi:hypothetical protein